MKPKKMQEKNGAHTTWSRSILLTTALLDLGALGQTFLSRVVYQRCPAFFQRSYALMRVQQYCNGMANLVTLVQHLEPCNSKSLPAFLILILLL